MTTRSKDYVVERSFLNGVKYITIEEEAFSFLVKAVGGAWPPPLPSLFTFPAQSTVMTVTGKEDGPEAIPIHPYDLVAMLNGNLENRLIDVIKGNGESADILTIDGKRYRQTTEVAPTTDYGKHLLATIK